MGNVTLEFKAGSQEVLPNWDDGFEGCWTWGKEKSLNELSSIVAKTIGGKWKIFRKAYASAPGEIPKKQLKSIWAENRHHTEKGQIELNQLFSTKSKIFQSPKSLDVLMDAMKMIQKDNFIVLDFFSGSATSAHAVMKLNSLDEGSRQFIMVQIPEKTAEESEAYKAGYKNICEIGKERIRRAGMKIKEENPLTTQKLDTGFRVFKLDTTNMTNVYYTPDELPQDLLDSTIDNIKHDRTGEDLLFQVMLEFGLPLDLKVTKKLIQGKEVFFVNDNDLIACFAKDVDDSLVKELSQVKPLYAVFRDLSFASDSVKININEIFKLYSPTTEIKVL